MVGMDCGMVVAGGGGVGIGVDICGIVAGTVSTTPDVGWEVHPTRMLTIVKTMTNEIQIENLLYGITPAFRSRWKSAEDVFWIRWSSQTLCV